MKSNNFNSSEIMFMEGNINYTEIFFNTGKKEISSSTLLRHEEQQNTFVRVSRKFLINPAYIIGYNVKGNLMIIHLNNGDQVQVSRRRIKNVLSRIDKANF